MIIAIALAVFTATPTYQIRDHGALSKFEDINGTGAAVGGYDDFWNGSEMEKFPPKVRSGIAINDLGLIAAQGWDDPSDDFAVKVKDKTVERLPNLQGLRQGHARNINSSGTVVGECGSKYRGRPVFWHDTVVEEIPLLPDDKYGWAAGINSAGVIVGVSANPAKSRPFIYKDGKTEALPLPQGAMWGEANAINDAGVVVGAYRIDKAYVACCWTDGEFKSLGTLTGFPNSKALDVNDAGDIVGVCELDVPFLGDGPVPHELVESHAFLYRDGKMLDINKLIPGLNEDWLVYRINSINKSGMMAGEFSKKGDPFFGCILTPIPAKTKTALPARVD